LITLIPELMFSYALIMAAGRGSRMSPLTDVVPKALAPFNGNPLIHHGLSLIKNVIPNVYVTVGYRASQLSSYLMDYGVSGLFNTSGQGNAWWVFNTLLSLVDKPVLVLTCDNVVRLDVARIHDCYSEFGMPPCMVVPVRPVSQIEGDYITQQSGIVSALSRDRKTSCYCSGIQVLNPRAVNETMPPVDSFNDLWKNLIKSKSLYASPYRPEHWSSFDTMSQLSQSLPWL
jgi:NDP-sugar pyrophosphorylase family protein